jgi:hypothetical protein
MKELLTEKWWMAVFGVNLAGSATSAARPLSVQERRFQISWRSSLHRQ